MTKLDMQEEILTVMEEARNKIIQEGMRAMGHNRNIHSCPYKKGTTMHKLWMIGYEQAAEEMFV